MIKAFPRHTIRLSDDILSFIWDIVRKRQVFKGLHIREFEDEFSRYNEAKYALGVSSGRVGLYLAIKALNFKKDCEILLSSYNFHEVPIVVRVCGLKPVFVDVYPQTFNIDVSQIKKHISKRTKAILVTHIFGQPCDMNSIMNLAREYDLKIIEDCAHACGAEYKGQKVGTLGDVGIFSFGMGKNMPCFGGGAIMTNSDAVWEKINVLCKRHTYPSKAHLSKILLTYLINHFSTRKRVFLYTIYPILRILDLFNITLSSYKEEKITLSNKFSAQYQKKIINLQAAIGLKQLGTLDATNRKLRGNALIYNAMLRDIKGIQIPIERPGVKHNYLYYYILVRNREAFRKNLLKKGIDTEKNNLSACPNLKIFNDYQSVCPVSQRLSRDSVELPNNIDLTKNDIHYIAGCVRKAMNFI